MKILLCSLSVHLQNIVQQTTVNNFYKFTIEVKSLPLFETYFTNVKKN